MGFDVVLCGFDNQTNIFPSEFFFYKYGYFHDVAISESEYLIEIKVVNNQLFVTFEFEIV
jgi:hypothetical protein